MKVKYLIVQPQHKSRLNQFISTSTRRSKLNWTPQSLIDELRFAIEESQALKNLVKFKRATGDPPFEYNGVVTEKTCRASIRINLFCIFVQDSSDVQ